MVGWRENNLGLPKAQGRRRLRKGSITSFECE